MKLLLENFKKFINEEASKDAVSKAAKSSRQDKYDRTTAVMIKDETTLGRELRASLKDALKQAHKSGLPQGSIYDAVGQGAKVFDKRIKKLPIPARIPKNLKEAFSYVHYDPYGVVRDPPVDPLHQDWMDDVPQDASSQSKLRLYKLWLQRGQDSEPYKMLVSAVADAMVTAYESGLPLSRIHSMTLNHPYRRHSPILAEGNESGPFTKEDDRAILLKAMEGYLRKVPAYSKYYSQEQLSRVKVESLKWVEDDGMWEVQVSSPDDQGGIDSWLMWYGKDENIYYGDTEKFVIDGVEYHLAGEL